MKKKYINIVQNSNRVDFLTSCKMTHNFGALVTFALKFCYCAEAIFLIFRVCWEARGMACGPCFLAQNSVRHLVIRATWNLFFSCSAAQPCTIFEKMYGRCCQKRTKFQWCWEVTVRCVFGKYTVQRKIHTSFLRTGFGDMRIY